LDFLKGTGVAIITPFKKNGEIDFNAYEFLIDFYFNNGINYLVILGTTGESHSISFEEKDKILKAVVKFNKGRLPLIVGFGANNTQKLVNELSNFELKSFSAVLSVCPYYNKPSQVGLYEHFFHVSKASSIPLILYDVPSRTGVSISNETIFKYLKAPINELDLLIRTGGDRRISNFLLYHLAYTEIQFSKTLWPDFTEGEFIKCLEVFSKTERRFGKRTL